MGLSFFSKLDANSGFFQIVLNPDSSKLATFITPFGRYCYRRLPMGISSVPEVFSRAIQEILESLKGVSNLVDDICVYAATKEEHDQRLEMVLQALQRAGVTLNADKCVFGAKTLKYLGYLITENGVHPDPNKVSAITSFPVPKDVSDVRRFVGMVNSLACFVPNLSTILKPLTLLLHKNVSWVWDVAQSEAFKQLKEILVSPDVLTLYDHKNSLCVQADSSAYGLGAVLCQKIQHKWKPVCYASRSLTPTECRYATIEKEALAITWACDRFQQYLFGKEFIIYTDHSPLVSLLSKKRLDDMPLRVQRFRMRLMRYSYDVQYIPGSKQIVADALSRAPVTDVKLSINEVSLVAEVENFVEGMVANLPASQNRLNEIRAQQNNDPVLSVVKKFCQSEWPSKCPVEVLPFKKVQNELSVINGILVKGSLLVIPTSLRVEILSKIHEGHLGIVKCQKRARSSVWWPSITNHIKHMVERCHTCLQFKVNRAEPMISTPFPERPWQMIGIDLCHLNGKQYLVVVDYFSRFIEIPLCTTTTANVIISHVRSIFSRFGIPEEVRSDGGPPFNSKEFRKFSEEYGFYHNKSSPYYSQSNGEVERAVQTVKNILKRAHVEKSDPYLALLAYRSAPLACGYSPAQLLMGRQVRTTVPSLPEVLMPKWPPLGEVNKFERFYRKKIKANFDDRKGVCPLSHLHQGQTVFLNNQKATVVSDAGNRSYNFEKKDGGFCI